MSLWREIILRSAQGAERARVFVDDGDYERLRGQGWWLGHTGYAIRMVRGKRIYMHREVLGLGAHRDDPRKVDHINRDTLDNRRANLRIATDAENAQNQGARARKLRPSQYRGVVWDQTRGKWRAQAVVAGRCHNLGRFDDELEAHGVVSEFRREHMPFSEEAAA